jgi:hypothetical protein
MPTTNSFVDKSTESPKVKNVTNAIQMEEINKTRVSCRTGAGVVWDVTSQTILAKSVTVEERVVVGVGVEFVVVVCPCNDLVEAAVVVSICKLMFFIDEDDDK